LIDCPGVVYPSGDTDTEIILKGVVRVENVKEPEEHIPAVLDRVKPEYLIKTYRIDPWTDPTDFLSKCARRSGKLLKGGEPDLPTISKMILNDWQRGKLPYFIKPPPKEEEAGTSAAVATATTTEPITEPSIKQDLSKLQTTAEFETEDNKELEVKAGEDLYVSDGEEGKDEDEDSDDEHEVQAEEEDGEDATTDSPQAGTSVEASEKAETRSTKKRKTVLKNAKEEGGEDVPKKKLSSKEKRSLERLKKQKKTGTNFYDVVNVKNRNRSKKSVLDMSLAYRGHQKTAPKK
jgi:nuclear GTP-binding protein